MSQLSMQGRARYRFSDHSQNEQSTQQGIHVFKQGSNIDLWGPCYGTGITTVRFFPGKYPEGGITPYRTSAEPNHFGDWLRRYPVMRKAGDPGVTFLLYDPANAPLDPQTNPAWVLYNAINRAVTTGQDQPGWARLLKGATGRSAMLPKPGSLYLAYGSIWRYKEKDYMPPRGGGPRDNPVVFGMPQSAGESLVRIGNEINPTYNGGEGDWERQMANGDLIDWRTGRFVTFYTLSNGDPRSRSQARQVNAQAAWQGGDANQQRERVDIGYGAFADPFSPTGVPAGLPGPEIARDLEAKIRPWDDIVEFLSFQQQAHLLADKFPPDVILYAFRGHPDWIPENVARQARGAVTAPAASPGGWDQIPPPQTTPLPPQGQHGYPSPQAPPAPPPPPPPPQQPASWGQQPGTWGEQPHVPQASPIPAGPAPQAPQAPPAQYAPPPHQQAPPPQQAPAGWGAPPPQAPPQARPAAQVPPVADHWMNQPNPAAQPGWNQPQPAVDPALARGGIPPGLPAAPPPPVAPPPVQQQPPAGPLPAPHIPGHALPPGPPPQGIQQPPNGFMPQPPPPVAPPAPPTFPPAQGRQAVIGNVLNRAREAPAQ